jgi:hypothetical protein
MEDVEYQPQPTLGTRWRELAMPLAWENAPDPEFTNKAKVIRDRWRAAIGQASAV